ncbi:ATP-binding protein [Spirosoma sp. KNUC1025]|uniref:ATP-binding protein n=1 Tax=Spirosoma sp. KNUC1025 TaxID=2894082 RepID=UPI003869074B|nr:PAS domain-containing protein [Spirosoma sp. KNUC1025]
MNTLFPPNSASSASRTRSSKNAVLILEFDSADIPVPSFRVRQANAEAMELAGQLPFSPVGALLDQLPFPFNSPELLKQLHLIYEQGISSQFQLHRSGLPITFSSTYDCQLLKADERLVVLSLVEVGQELGKVGSLEQMMETMPTGLALFQALRNARHEIIDFQAIFCNQAGAAISRQSRHDILTRPISERYPNMEAYELFHRYVAVVTTDQPYHQLLYLPPQDIWLDVSVVKYGDGLLVSFQDVTLGQKSALLLESVMSSSPAAVRYYESIRDESGQIIDFMTSTGNELPAYRPFRPTQSTTGKRLLELYPYLRENGLFDRYKAVVQTGQSDHFETSRQVGDHVVWFDCRAVRHGNGFVLTTLDITARKEAQLAQQQQASLLQTVLDNSLTGIAWLKTVRNPAGMLVDFTLEKINATLAQLLGRSLQDLEGKPLSELMPHQMVNGLFDRYATVSRTGQAQRFEWANEAGTIWYDLSTVAIDDGLIVTFMDITAIKLAQLDLQRQADLITGVLNSSTSSILLLDPLYDLPEQISDFRISLANPATLRLFSHFVGRDFTQEDLLNQTILTLFPTVRERAVFPALASVSHTGKSIHTSIDYPQLGLTYEYDIRPFRKGVLMITTDITPLRVYQQQLEANNIALSRSNEYLQQFAYVASHDLQEPLRKIQSFGDILLTQYADNLDAVGQDLLRRQQNAAQRMQILVKDLLDYSRLSTQQPPFQPVSLELLLQDVLSDLETTILETKARVTTAQLPTIAGNATQLRQLLQNLVTNALKFTKPDQPPVVRVEASLISGDQLPQPRLTGNQEQWVALQVIDKGIGFSESYQERIFELFQRLHGRNEYIGTGIGLAIVKKVVENHRGFITAHSQPGAGATFTVYLPQA